MSDKVTTISSKNSLSFNFRELMRYKDLFWTLAWKDYKVRYVQTSLGIVWAFFQPLATLTILYFVFGRFVEIETNGVPHLVFTAASLSLWTYFAFVLTNSGKSIIDNQGMLKKIYFPRIIFPLSKAIVGLIDFGIALLIFVVLIIYYQVPISGYVWLAPFFILMGIIVALSVGILFSAMTVKNRDVQHVIPFLVQLGLYITPVAYPTSEVMDRVPNSILTLYHLNPMTGVIEGFRWSIFGGAPPDMYSLISFSSAFVLFLVSLIYFKRTENKMADYV